jgi:two-component sensor histidine kinase
MDVRERPPRWKTRQNALAHFATEAMRNDDLDRPMQIACEHVATGLQVPMAKLALKQADTDDLLLTAEYGLPPGLVKRHKTRLPGGNGSAMGYCVKTRRPVISDVISETRFEPSDIVRAAGVRISANVVIWSASTPIGCLEADSAEYWSATDDDIEFLQLYADLVSAALERARLAADNEALGRQQQVLMNEIFHRIKNLLANVLAIVRRTAAHSSSVAEFSKSMEGRIGALSRAHDLLLNAPSQPARLAELLELEFSAKGLSEDRQFTLDGPDIICGPRTLQALALLIFELATNATKHGALSENAPPSASIHVSWRITEDEKVSRVNLIWLEHGLRPRSQRRGFGSELLDRLVPQMLGGQSTLSPLEDGVRYEISFPLIEDTATFQLPLRRQSI